jgi:predicted GNAT family N-acyltransferase
MTSKRIEFGSDDFRKECALRQEVLRVPLGLNLYDEDLTQEAFQIHFGLFDDASNLIACVIAVPLSPTEAKVRQMAVQESLQGRGYGRQIVCGLECHLAEFGYAHLSLHARTSAVGFYEKLGYTTIGQEFMEVGIPHYRMEKCLC